MKRTIKYIKVSLITFIVGLLVYITVLACLNAVANQQDYDHRQMVIKCQEGWQYYCRKLVKNHVVVGEDNE